jgi:hypothetical protein
MFHGSESMASASFEKRKSWSAYWVVERCLHLAGIGGVRGSKA